MLYQDKSTRGMNGIRTYLSESETNYNSRTCLVDIFFEYFIECIFTKGRYMPRVLLS
jgi:hypothetical protein